MKLENQVLNFVYSECHMYASSFLRDNDWFERGKQSWRMCKSVQGLDWDLKGCDGEIRV